ncbi:MAG TPA: hypothetical protein VLL54_07030 [Pyrinomonadaceae bacterium]|nr:hypothetical protein [Pyrinomonadaceae bacterium]
MARVRCMPLWGGTEAASLGPPSGARSAALGHPVRDYSGANSRRA